MSTFVQCIMRKKYYDYYSYYLTIITDQYMVVIPYILAILVFHFLRLLLLPLTFEDEPLPLTLLWRFHPFVLIIL